MIWVFTAPHPVKGEIEIIKDLLQAGAHKVVLRKPDWTAQQYTALLEKMDAQFYRQIIIRDNCWLYKSFRLGGVHWSRENREMLLPAQLQKWVSNHPHSSTGVHTLSEIASLDGIFNYLLLSPVFNSISKTDYDGRFMGIAPAVKYSRLIALGGIHERNIDLLPGWNFSGAAVLGYIWQHPNQALNKLQQLQQQWQLGVEKKMENENKK
ncbi:MAG: thiamine phosphate synthase [Chitinophaga sp.]|uniref:thiamine phosphate synthase n=1 Tax=Chitinophaga sp. TaxID=1869181 RepID=UPI0025B94DB0|nr:thiamine phosphate synthase [Chitinophaga sp.]MBV8254785.1 thiamine phosphate synthase [Chitinophaga sp.]